MNVTSKLDLDRMLNDWPAPADDEAAWETRAARIVDVALSRRSEDTAAMADLLAAPDLAAEPGEEHAGDILRDVRAAGERSTMADGSETGRASKSEASLSGGSASRPPEKKRQSLKEIAERASQAPGRVHGVPGSNPALSTPLPSGRGPLSTPVPSGRGPLSTPVPPSGRGSMPPGRGSISGALRASSPSLRPAEGVTEDSGVIDLNRLSASVPPEQVEAAEKAQPGTADLLDEDEKPTAVAAVSARRPRAPSAPVAEASAKKRSGGMLAGAALAALGLAAAVAVVVKTKAPSQQTTADTMAAPPAVLAPATPREERPAQPAAPVAAAPAAPVESADPEQQPVEAAEKLAAAPKAPAASVGAGAAPPAAPASPAATPKPEPGNVAAAPTTPGKPGDLPSAMQAAVGDNGEKQPSVVSEAPMPASGPLRQQNIPEQPSQGSVQAALGSVMSSARACVAGADDVSRAQITFSSTGQVSKVSVSGWAAANGQSSCVQAALKGANVGPFSKPSFAVSATIRP